MKITRQAFKEMAKDGKIFTITFIKKNGEERVMNARLGVKKHLTGGEQKYKPADYNLLTVFDMQKQGYRNVSFDCVKKVVIGGITLVFEEETVMSQTNK